MSSKVTLRIFSFQVPIQRTRLGQLIIPVKYENFLFSPLFAASCKTPIHSLFVASSLCLEGDKKQTELNQCLVGCSHSPLWHHEGLISRTVFPGKDLENETSNWNKEWICLIFPGRLSFQSIGKSNSALYKALICDLELWPLTLFLLSKFSCEERMKVIYAPSVGLKKCNE